MCEKLPTKDCQGEDPGAYVVGGLLGVIIGVLMGFFISRGEIKDEKEAAVRAGVAHWVFRDNGALKLEYIDIGVIEREKESMGYTRGYTEAMRDARAELEKP